MGTGTPPENTERIFVRMIAISAPQQVHRIGARSLTQAIRVARSELERQVQQGNQALAVRMQKAVIAIKGTRFDLNNKQKTSSASGAIGFRRCPL